MLGDICPRLLCSSPLPYKRTNIDDILASEHRILGIYYHNNNWTCVKNSDPMYRRSRAKDYHNIKCTWGTDRIVCNAVFRLTRSCWVPVIRDQIAKLPQIAWRVWRFGSQNFVGNSPSSCWPTVVNMGHRRTP